MSSGVVTLSPLSQAGVVDDDVVAMVMEASLDPGIRNQTYLVHVLDEKGARAYCQKSDGVALRHDGIPIGVAIIYQELPPLPGIEIPAGSCVEIDAWALPRARSIGLLGRRGGWPSFAAWMALRFDWAFSVIFADNELAQAHARSIGGKRLGRTFLPSRGIPGFRDGEVEVYIYELAPYKTVHDRAR